MLNDAPRDQKLEWLAQALVHARQIADPVPRAHFLAWIAGGLLKVGEDHRGLSLLEESQRLAEQLPRENFDAMLAFERIAESECKVDLPSCLQWLDRIGHASRYGYACGMVAAELATINPAAAEEVWNHVAIRNDQRALDARSLSLPQFFFTLAMNDRRRAEGLAATMAHPLSRARAYGAVSRGIAENDAAEARSLLVRAIAEAAKGGHSAERAIGEDTPATSLAWLLPISRRVAPDMTAEMIWRAISLRKPRASEEGLDDEFERTNAILAQMLAPFNRQVAKAIITPFAPRLPTFTHPASDGQQLWEILTAAAIIDPQWSVDLFRSLPDPPDLASNRAQNQTRMVLARFLAYPYERRLQSLNYFDPE
jgi:hypothetical protein